MEKVDIRRIACTFLLLFYWIPNRNNKIFQLDSFGWKLAIFTVWNVWHGIVKGASHDFSDCIVVWQHRPDRPASKPQPRAQEFASACSLRSGIRKLFRLRVSENWVGAEFASLVNHCTSPERDTEISEGTRLRPILAHLNPNSDSGEASRISAV